MALIMNCLGDKNRFVQFSNLIDSAEIIVARLKPLSYLLSLNILIGPAT